MKTFLPGCYNTRKNKDIQNRTKNTFTSIITGGHESNDYGKKKKKKTIIRNS